MQRVEYQLSDLVAEPITFTDPAMYLYFISWMIATGGSNKGIVDLDKTSKTKFPLNVKNAVRSVYDSITKNGNRSIITEITSSTGQQKIDIKKTLLNIIDANPYIKTQIDNNNNYKHAYDALCNEVLGNKNEIIETTPIVKRERTTRAKNPTTTYSQVINLLEEEIDSKPFITLPTTSSNRSVNNPSILATKSIDLTLETTVENKSTIKPEKMETEDSYSLQTVLQSMELDTTPAQSSTSSELDYTSVRPTTFEPDDEDFNKKQPTFDVNNQSVMKAFSDGKFELLPDNHLKDMPRTYPNKENLARYITNQKTLGKGIYGIFTKQSISGKKSFFLGQYKGEILPTIYAVNDTSYVMSSTDSSEKKKTHFIDAKFKGSSTRYFNHSDFNFNAIITDEGDGYVLIETIGPMEKGDEILMNYSDAYGSDQGGELVAITPAFSKYSSKELLYKFSYNRDQAITLPEELAKFVGVETTDEFYAPVYFESILKNERPPFDVKKKKDLNIPLLFKTPNGNVPVATVQQKGLTPLMVAAYLGNLESIQWLVDNGANINQQTRFGHTAIFYLLRSQRINVAQKIEILNYLIENNKPLLDENKKPLRTDLACQDIKGLTPLHWCIQLGDIALIKSLIKDSSKQVKNQIKKALEGVTYGDEFCPFTYALNLGKYDIFKFLIEYDKKFLCIEANLSELSTENAEDNEDDVEDNISRITRACRSTLALINILEAASNTKIDGAYVLQLLAKWVLTSKEHSRDWNIRIEKNNLQVEIQGKSIFFTIDKALLNVDQCLEIITSELKNSKEEISTQSTGQTDDIKNSRKRLEAPHSSKNNKPPKKNWLQNWMAEPPTQPTNQQLGASPLWFDNTPRK